MDFAFDADDVERRPPSGLDGSGAEQQSLCMSASSTSMETVRFIHRWTIDQFSVQQELSSIGDYLESSPFGTANNHYRFRLKLFPCGKDDDCRGFLSLFLQIQRCPGAKLRFRVNFYIETTEGPRGCALNRNIVTINKGGIVTASKFYSMETLKTRASRFLPDDTLTVGVELTVFGDHMSREIHYDDACEKSSQDSSATSLADNGPATGTLGFDLGHLWESKDHTDCMLHVGRRSFPTHKAILAARSPVFAAMFGHKENVEAQNNEATLEDVTPEAVQAVLEYIYTDRCTDLQTRAADILAAADKYCLDRLKNQCETALCEDLSAQNACERLRLADSYSAARLRRRALHTLQKHRPQVLGSREWADLEQECPALAAKILKELWTMPEQLSRLSTGGLHDSSSKSSEPSTKRPRMS